MFKAFLIQFAGFIPALHTAATTDGFLTVFDFVAAFLGMTLSTLILERKEEKQ